MDWKPISTAPRDGRVVALRSTSIPHGTAMAWEPKRNQWEGRTFAPMGAIRTYWDESVEPPTEWREIILHQRNPNSCAHGGCGGNNTTQNTNEK